MKGKQSNLSEGENINSKDNEGDGLLHKAAWNNSKDVGEILIENGADVNDRNKDGQTPLHDAALNDSKEMLELLISKGGPYRC